MRFRPLAATVLAATLVVGGVLLRKLSAQPIQFQPFSAVVHETKFNGKGVKGHESDSIRAMRSDGSFVISEERAFPDGKNYSLRTIIDVSYRRRVVVHAATGSVTTYPLSTGAVRKYVADLSSCRALASERQAMNNIETVRDKSEVPGLIRDRWLAPSLNCFALQESVSNGSAHNERVVTSISLGEPDPALFAVPNGYVERSPAEVAVELTRKFPSAPPADFGLSATAAHNSAQKNK